MVAVKQNFVAVALALGQLGAIGWLDYVTGYEVSLAIFYFLPIAYAAWHLGSVWSQVFAVLSAIILTWAERASGARFSQDWVFWEHGLMRVLVFGFVAFSFSFFRRTLDRERERIRHLEGALLTFCSCCAKVRDPNDDWVELATYLRENTSVATRTRLCPTCSRQTYATGVGVRGPVPSTGTPHKVR